MNAQRVTQAVPVRFLSMFLVVIAWMWSLPALSTARVGAPSSFADLAERLGPTVVNIYTTQTVKAPKIPHPFFDNEDIPEPFRKFFEFPSPFNPLPQKEMKRTSLGSGVIISPDGFIATNNHVVEDADEIHVKLANYEEYEAKIVGRDPKTDLALIKIEPKHPLQAVEMGDSERLRVGDWVIAIGNPFGFEQTVTAGIVSGKGRSLGSGPYENFIQTDASINPGNSGGPLFNLDGRMVGINTAIYSRSGGNIGIGFAIPVNMARNVLQQLKEHGSVTRGWLGVLIQHVTPELAEQFGLERPIGALVGEVTPKSPADKAGIKPGDVIVEYNGKEITQMSQLPSLVAQTPVGEKAKIVLIRKGKRKTVTATIAKLDEEKLSAAGTGRTTMDEKLGLTVQELTPELAQALDLDETQGVIVTEVEPGSAAQQAGIRRGDLVIEVNQQPVKDLDDYRKAIASSEKSGSVLFLLRRQGHNRFVAITIR